MDSSNGEVVLTPIWRPGMFGKTKMDEFREMINKKFGLKLSTYWELYDWSVDNFSQFWEQFWIFSKIIFSNPYEIVVEKHKPIEEIPKWFIGSKLNFTQNIFERIENSDPNKVALYVVGESMPVPERVTFGQMKSRVNSLMNAMKMNGIGVGDRVVGYLPNGRVAVEAFLAASAIGAIWSSTSPDFGISGIIERLRQIKPKILFTVDSVVYNGKRHNLLDKLLQIINTLNSLIRVIISPLDSDVDKNQNQNELNSLLKSPKCVTLDRFIAEAVSQKPITYFEAPFNHPLCILFSSGTTGEPKCLVHSVGGTLIQHLKEHLLHGNMGSNDILMFYTTTGWMMWNWMVSALAAGAAIVLYDGSPFKPSISAIWDVIDKIGVTILGTSPKGLQMMEVLELKPKYSHNLERLHTILSTGSPLSANTYEFVYNCIKKDVLLGSITGGSDIISCFAGQNPTIAVYPGEIQSINLGMAIQCWDEKGNAVKDETGELVCTKPFPSMPTMFWNDFDGNKYKKSYFSGFKGVWTHGDYISINGKTNGIKMLGRSDGTLNPNGVRFGSSEIYNIIEVFKEVKDSVCVSQYNQTEERVVLFIKMQDSYELNKELIDRIKATIRDRLSPRHIPSLILPVSDIPYTINGKKVEIAVKLTIAGKEVVNKNSIANPESLELFRNRSELKDF